jgi:hypothetical protein
MAAKKTSAYPEATEAVERTLADEAERKLDTLTPYEAFRDRAAHHRDLVREYFRSAKAEGRRVFGYGASTKGNVLLQYCGLTADELPVIAEVNEDKFGAFTPGTLIPIVSEAEARSMRPDAFFVLPWHFRDGIVKREAEFLDGGGQLVFPLPEFSILKR